MLVPKLLSLTLIAAAVAQDDFGRRVAAAKVPMPAAIARGAAAALSTRTNDVYYFGEAVDIYQGGAVVAHDGAWLSGENGARFGLMMPGTPLLGARFHQEVAPQVAMDRVEVTALDATVSTPLRQFERVLVMTETTPLERGKSLKHYAAGIGLIGDGELKLVRAGKAGN